MYLHLDHRPLIESKHYLSKTDSRYAEIDIAIRSHHHECEFDFYRTRKKCITIRLSNTRMIREPKKKKEELATASVQSANLAM
jgi:hypothetical protein